MGAKLYDISIFYKLGVDPLTGLPSKYVEGKLSNLMNGIKRILRIKDEQEFVSRFSWDGLPKGITGEMIERILYYRGQLAIFKISDEEFVFLPYAVSGTVDCYGRHAEVRPLVFGGAPATKAGGEIKDESKFFNDETFFAIHDESYLDKAGDPAKCAVILKDYTPQLSYHIVPRSEIQEPLIQMEAEGFPLMRTNRIANSGVRGMRVNDEGAAGQVKLASQAIKSSALEGDPLVPVVDELEFQELMSTGSQGACEDYLMYIQAIDNFRRSTLGFKAKGLFEKKAHTLQSEEDANEDSGNAPLQDGLANRERFADLANLIYGLNISVRKNEELRQDQEEKQKGDEGGKDDAKL